MSRYTRLQTLPNSPLTPLTPLSENPAFNFNIGGDRSLDVYIANIRSKHLVEHHQKSTILRKSENQMEPKRYSERFLKLRDVFEPNCHEKCHRHQKIESRFEVPPCQFQLQDPPKKFCYHAAAKENKASNHHIVHRKNCEMQRQKQKQQQLQQQQQQQHVCQQQLPQTFATSKFPVQIIQTKATPPSIDYDATPKNVRLPLRQRNHNVATNQPQRLSHMLIQQQQQQQRRSSNIQPLRVTSPVPLRPLCPRVSKILHQCGLSMYCGLFQKEEIDMFIFKLLQRQDLQQLGVTDPKHCNILINEICYASQYV